MRPAAYMQYLVVPYIDPANHTLEVQTGHAGEGGGGGGDHLLP